MFEKNKLAALIATVIMSGTALAHNGQVPDEKEQQVDCRTLFNFTFPKILDFMTSIDCSDTFSRT